MTAILEIDDLHTHFRTRDGVVRAIEGLSLTVQAGEVLGIVGESGCGKSVTALSVMRLIPSNAGGIVKGQGHGATTSSRELCWYRLGATHCG